MFAKHFSLLTHALLRVIVQGLAFHCSSSVSKTHSSYFFLGDDSSSDETEVQEQETGPDLPIDIEAAEVQEFVEVEIEIRQEDQDEEAAVQQFLNNTCECNFGVDKTACSTVARVRECVRESRSLMQALTKAEQDTIILAKLDCMTRPSNAGGGRSHVKFFFQGTQVCQKTFLFMHNLGIKRYKNLLKHYQTDGMLPREHGRKGKLPHNAHPIQHVHFLVRFI